MFPGVKIKADSDDCILFYGWGQEEERNGIYVYEYYSLSLFLRCFDLVSAAVFIAVLIQRDS